MLQPLSRLSFTSTGAQQGSGRTDAPHSLHTLNSHFEDVVLDGTPAFADVPEVVVPLVGEDDDVHTDVACLRRFMLFRDSQTLGGSSSAFVQHPESDPSTEIRARITSRWKRKNTNKVAAYDSSDREALLSDDEVVSPDMEMWTTPPTQYALTGNVQPLQVGCRYVSMDTLRETVQFVVVAKGFHYKRKRSHRTRFHVICVNSHCPWELEGRAAHVNTPTEIVRLTPHRPGCRASVEESAGNKHAKVKWVELMVLKKLREKIETTAIDLRKWFAETIKTPVSYSKCVRARARVVETLKGAPDAGYIHLHTYCRVVRETNPGSIIELDCNGNVFVRIFCAFAASVTGFAHCMLLLVLDGAHIRRKYECCLFGATARDANDQCFPVAYAVIDAESKKNWKWFLVLLKRVCDAAHVPHDKITIMSDQDKGLIPAVSKEFGDDRLRVNKEQAKMLLEAARATSEPVFDYYMQRVADFSKDKHIVEKIFAKADKRHWGGPHIRSPRYGKVTSQVAESMNNKFLKARGMPPIPLLEEYRGPSGRGRPPKLRMQYRVSFRHHLDPKEDRWFTREELLRTAPQVIAGYERELKGKMPAD
ncbi:hypothetical protein CBR_g27991 [Chara braunii]|uniref:MULE transposase domain-containing protein n=1 Tax=Chara braunii TaxID=69332 RepID=A0A388L8Y7_CHABU|nr:hypothetical protein CBR_g27991 [Chara braunii]|eukprot:GBG78767.1 hypothetical protein CBR_g27991 [Chara braunii]